MKKRLKIYCEGQTEEMIVNRLLKGHLYIHGIHVERPVLAATSLDPAGQRGGFVNWAAIQFDLSQQFAADPDPNLRFTTLLDAYAMPIPVLNLGGFNAPLTTTADIDTVERAIEAVFNEPRFKAYLQRHELEALLLADLDALERVFHRHKPGLQQLRADIVGFASPEDINHGATSHPAARLTTAVTGYEDLKASNAYWIKNASEHTVEELRELLPGLAFLRATGELNAIREITEEKQMYDAREKASLDIQSNLIDARQEGRQEGIEIGEERGKLKGSVQIYEGLLGASVSSDDELSKKSTDELVLMVIQLQKRLRDRTS